MTDYPDALVEVTQADRDAAADWYVGQNQDADVAGFRKGHFDWHPMIQAFARHAAAARKAAMEEAAKVCDAGLDNTPHRSYAEAIRNLAKETDQ